MVQEAQKKSKFSVLYGKKVDFSPILCKKAPFYTRYGYFKMSCCFFIISLRSIINLAHDFKSPFLDKEITISNKLYQKVTTRPSFTFINPYLALHHSGLHIIHLCPQSRGNHRKNLRFAIPSFNLLYQEVMIILHRKTCYKSSPRRNLYQYG